MDAYSKESCQTAERESRAPNINTGIRQQKRHHRNQHTTSLITTVIKADVL